MGFPEMGVPLETSSISNDGIFPDKNHPASLGTSMTSWTRPYVSIHSGTTSQQGPLAQTDPERSSSGLQATGLWSVSHIHELGISPS